MFRDLIPRLSDRFHMVAPDYPGFGASSMPAPGEFDYTFDKFSEVIDQFIARLGIEALQPLFDGLWKRETVRTARPAPVAEPAA